MSGSEFIGFVSGSASEEACALRCIILAMAAYICGHAAFQFIKRFRKP